MQRIKDTYNNIRRHWKLFVVIAFLLFVCYRMFVANYELQQPVISKRAETYISLWNERAACLTDLDLYKKNAAENSAQSDM